MSEAFATEAEPAPPSADLATRVVWVDLHGELPDGVREQAQNRGPVCGSVHELRRQIEDAQSQGASLGFAVSLGRDWQPADRDAIRECLEATAECRVALLSSFSAHFGDHRWIETERAAIALCQEETRRRVAVLRLGNLTAAGPSWLRPLLTAGWRSCFVEPAELEQAVHALHAKPAWPSLRTLTLLGANRALAEALPEPKGVVGSVLHAVCLALSYLFVGRLIALVGSIGARVHAPWRRFRIGVMEPQSVRELLALYNPYNARHVAIAGYNTGVTHFGWKYPGKTIVKTVETGRRARVRGASIEVDAGVTLKRAITELDAAGREFYVVPNYSYISMGTVFFVPVHGSGSEYSTLGDTLESALLYDPAADRFLRVRRGDADFDRCMYYPPSGVLALRLRLNTKPKSGYFVRREELDSPKAEQVWGVFHDSEASNIEVRKAQAGDSQIEVSKYYTSEAAGEGLLEVPRDKIGRLWDRIEETPVVSFLFHELVKRIGFHVELFLTEEQFAVFWAAHQRLPLSKIQLRYVRADGLPHSPFGDRDCVSADLFMKRKTSAEFLAFMRDELPDAKHNPGKHSM
ncbi:MAG: hypothetical protein AAGA92_15455 [Planctomycetota bacterium]